MCPIPEASKTEGHTLRTSEVLGRCMGVVSPNSQTRGPPSVCRPLLASRAATARLVSPGDAPRQRNMLLPGCLRRVSRSRLTPVILACPADPGQPGTGPGGGRGHEQHRAGEQARSVPPARRLAEAAAGLSCCPSRSPSHARLLAAFLQERASFLGGSYPGVAP